MSINTNKFSEHLLNLKTQMDLRNYYKELLEFEDEYQNLKKKRNKIKFFLYEKSSPSMVSIKRLDFVLEKDYHDLSDYFWLFWHDDHYRHIRYCQIDDKFEEMYVHGTSFWVEVEDPTFSNFDEKICLKYKKIWAARLIQKNVKRWLSQPRYKSGNLGLVCRKAKESFLEKAKNLSMT